MKKLQTGLTIFIWLAIGWAICALGWAIGALGVVDKVVGWIKSQY